MSEISTFLKQMQVFALREMSSSHVFTRNYYHDLMPVEFTNILQSMGYVKGKYNEYVVNDLEFRRALELLELLEE